MAAAAMSEEQRTVLATMSTDLKFILSDKGLPPALQVRIGQHGFTTLSLFSLLSDTRTELRAYLSGSLGLDPMAADLTEQERIDRRINTARIIDAWETAKIRVEERARLEASQRASRTPLTLMASDHVNLRRTYEAEYGAVTDKKYPAEPAVERRFNEIEQGDLKAESLRDVPSRDEMIEDPVGASLDRDGTLRLRKGHQQVPLPQNSEDLRRRIAILGITYTLARYKHGHRTWLQGAAPAIWTTHVEWILGEDIAGFRVTVAGQAHCPAWSQVLHFEHEVRKEATRLMAYEGHSLASSFELCRRDTTLKERHFSTPVAIA